MHAFVTDVTFTTPQLYYRNATIPYNGTATTQACSERYGYTECICGPLTGEYLRQNCHPLTGTERNDYNPSLNFFARYDCPVEREWKPYRNQWEACKALTLSEADGYLFRTTTMLIYGLLYLWVYWEYDMLRSAEYHRLQKQPDRLHIVTTAFARFFFAIASLCEVAFLAVQLTAFVFIQSRSYRVSILPHEMLVNLAVTTGLLGSLSMAVDTITRRVADTLGRQTSAHYDCFLTHDWGTDENGRSNHARVSRVNALLKARGFITWFDEERMDGNINQQMASGVDLSKAVIVFITERYMQKVSGEGDRGDDDNWSAALELNVASHAPHLPCAVAPVCSLHASRASRAPSPLLTQQV